MRFFDEELLKAENAHNEIEMFSNPVFDAILNPSHKLEFMAKLKKEKKESFEIAKTRWVAMAQKNIKP